MLINRTEYLDPHLTALYARVSDAEKQGDNFSISTQLAQMRSFCEAQGWQVVEELQERDSAFLDGLSRSELNKALALARQGKINALLFFSADRFTRDMADGVILRRELKRLGVRLFCFYPNFHEISSDMEIMHILTDWQSQQFVEKMREASMRGIRGKVDAGLFPGGRPPYGYKLVGKKRDSHLEVVEEEAAVVRQIFNWYVYEDLGTRDIAARLNEMRIPPSRVYRQNKGWTMRNVGHVLRRESYTGVWYAYRKRTIAKGKQVKRPREDWVPIEIPVIIPRGLFDQAKRRLTSRHVGRVQKSFYLMSSRIDCSCGYRAKGHRQQSHHTRDGDGMKVYLYYRCGSSENLRGICGMPKFRADRVDAVVWKFAYELINEPERLLRGYRELQEETTEENESLQRQIEGLEAQIAEQHELLASLVEQRASAKSVSLQLVLDDRAEECGTTIDDLVIRLHTLQETRRAQPFTEEHIQTAVREIAALRDMYEALHAINEEADYQAQRALIDILNLTATMRIDASGVRWVDIHWLRRVYPRPIDPKDDTGTGIWSIGVMMILTFSFRLLG